MKFETLNQINESIKSINQASYSIRLCALNSQITIARITHTHGILSGFSPISSELIRMSKLIEEKAEKLFSIISESLIIITKELKIQRNKKFLEIYFSNYKKTNQKFNFNSLEIKIFNHYDLVLNEMGRAINQNLSSLNVINEATSKICKQIRPLSFSVKIESAHIGEKLELFDELASGLVDFVQKIETLIGQIESTYSHILEEEK